MNCPESLALGVILQSELYKLTSNIRTGSSAAKSNLRLILWRSLSKSVWPNVATDRDKIVRLSEAIAIAFTMSVVLGAGIFDAGVLGASIFDAGIFDAGVPGASVVGLSL